MKTLILPFCLLFFFSLFIFSCKEDDANPPTADKLTERTAFPECIANKTNLENKARDLAAEIDSLNGVLDQNPNNADEIEQMIDEKTQELENLTSEAKKNVIIPL